MKRQFVTFDWAMKKLLRSKANFEILEGFLAELLKEEIKIQEILESDVERDIETGSFQNQFNELEFIAINKKKERVFFEIKYDRELDFCKKMYNASLNFMPENKKCLSNVQKHVFININHFDVGRGEDYVYRCVNNFQGIHKNDILKMNIIQEKVMACKINRDIPLEKYLIRVNAFDNIIENCLDEWIYFFKKTDIKSDFKAQGLNQAAQKLNILSLTEPERQIWERYSDNLHYQASMYESSYVSGKNKGYEEVLQKGIEKGKLESKLDIARKMLVMQLDIDLIVKVTGLTKEQITDIKK